MSRPEILQLSLTLVPSSHSIANLLPSPSNFASHVPLLAVLFLHFWASYLSFSSIFGHQFPSSLPKLAHEFTDSDSSCYPFLVSRPHLQRNPLSRKLRLSPVPKLSVPLPVSILGSKSKPFTMRPCIVGPSSPPSYSTCGNSRRNDLHPDVSTSLCLPPEMPYLIFCPSPKPFVPKCSSVNRSMNPQ